MLKRNIKIEFTELIPENLEKDILYISEKYKACIHLCSCGCGETISTPITGSHKERSWDLIKNQNNTISLYPSIGNWQYNCKSHYWIQNNQIIPA